MGSRVDLMTKKGLINPPSFLKNNIHYEVIMGSVAYGVASDTSDMDVYGFCIPPKHIIFPHTNGIILGFDSEYEKFDQWQQHHIMDKEANQEYDFSIHNIVKYFSLCMQNNPNMIDSLFVPRRCVLHSTNVGNMVRENRKLFLHKGAWHKFKGYAFSQLAKMQTKKIDCLVPLMALEDKFDIPHDMSLKEALDIITPNTISHDLYFEKLGNTHDERVDTFAEYSILYQKAVMASGRTEMVKAHGFDSKFAYHIVRLLDEVEQILIEGDIDLERNREQLKAIRRGDWTREMIVEYFNKKESELESLYISSKLQHQPDKTKIKQLLIDCLEEHYGDLSSSVIQPDLAVKALIDIHNQSEKVLYSMGVFNK